MKKIKLILVGLLLLAPAYTLSQGEEEEAVSGQELLETCDVGSAPGRPNQMCMQYVFGLVQTVTMLQQMEQGPQLFCIDPNVVSLEEATSKVHGWLAKQQPRLQEDAYVLVSEALNHHFPCAL